jgi:hypothetical protein
MHDDSAVEPLTNESEFAGQGVQDALSVVDVYVDGGQAWHTTAPKDEK